LEEIYAIVPPLMTNSKFVPYSLKYDSPDTYRSILRTQNVYLESHRNIPLAGITHVQMHESIQWDDMYQTPFEILTTLKGITRLDSTARTHDLGKFNMSTTTDTYIENTKWIDAKLASIFERTTPNDCLSKGDFPDPVRMGKKMVRRTMTRKTSTFAQQLRSQFPTTVGTPPPPITNAWNNHSRQVPQLNYTVEHFPSLSNSPAPVTPGNQPIPLPYQHAPSLSSQTTMTKEQTRSYIDECVKTEQAKFTASNASLSTDISNLRTEVKTMIDEPMKKQNVVMQGFIRKSQWPMPSLIPQPANH
jgi:hypothetical protein